MRRRLLFDAGDYPVSQQAASGLAVRIAELAETLADEFAVTVYSPDVPDPMHLGGARLERRADRWGDLLADTDAVFFFDVADPDRLAQAVAAGPLIVSETAPPIEHGSYPSLLRQDAPEERYREILEAYQRQLRASHHFICRSRVERATILASLVTLGRIGVRDLAGSATLDHLVTSVPIGFSRHSRLVVERTTPAPLADVLWTGGVWSFYDPHLLVDAVAICARRGLRISAAFLYGQPHPDTREIVEALEKRIADRAVGDLVTVVRQPVTHQARDAYLTGARAFVCVARPGVENDTCVRLRIRDSRLYGVPLIVDGFGATADEVRRHGLGRVLDEPSAETLAEALAETIAARTPGGAEDAFEYRDDLWGLVPRLHDLLGRVDDQR
ncbi:hypothetical protein GA0074692_2103 [Micromonospora pallida]|uniref:Uncharacterized protein n=2 Tax=Micromonospora pallida TaxID=145854 RepID=A0A1C6SA35_9ACTN|nr:hypothetical protein GA0074692_2103 [Micromonospora pallida]